MPDERPNTEVQTKPQRRTFSADDKRRIVAEAATCQRGELGALLRREGLTYSQLGHWRVAREAGTLDKKRGPAADPHRAEVKRLQAENARLKRQLERAELIIDAQKKLARLLEQEMAL